MFSITHISILRQDGIEVVPLGIVHFLHTQQIRLLDLDHHATGNGTDGPVVEGAVIVVLLPDIEGHHLDLSRAGLGVLLRIALLRSEFLLAGHRAQQEKKHQKRE